MLLASRLPRVLLAIIYLIVISAGVNVEHNIAGSIVVCSLHLAFRLLPDNCFCLSGRNYFNRELHEDVYDSIATVSSIVGCIFAVIQNGFGDSGVAVAIALALVTTVAFALGKSIAPPKPAETLDPEGLFEEEDEEI